MNEVELIIELTSYQLKIFIRAGVCCWYCKEPLKECEGLTYANETEENDTDVFRYVGRYWHRKCLNEWLKYTIHSV